MSSLTRSRIAIIAVVVLFIIPVVIAKLVLDQHWYQGAVTNRGTLLVPPLALSEETTAALPAGWRLLYRQPQACSDYCERALFTLNQVDVALGKDSQRVTPVLLTHSDFNHLNISAYQSVTRIESDTLYQVLHSLPARTVMIIDPMGNVVMHYPLHLSEQETLAEGKNILADLRRLLKLSRIG